MKKNLGLILTLLGAIGLIVGVVFIFTGKMEQSITWISAVLGIIFFTSGIGLMKSSKGGDASEG